MLTLLIVDDEPSTRSGLAECIDWLSFGISNIYCEEDGESALLINEEKQPDIVLLDVKMPGMDGIEVAERIRKGRYKSKIIFISGHGDVSYIKSALKVDAVDYIMKPINITELETVIEKTIQQISDERNRNQFMREMNAKLSQSLPLLREKFWMRAILDGFKTSDNLNEQLSFLEIDLALQSKYCVFIISIDNWGQVLNSMTERDRQLISFALLNMVQEFLDEAWKGYAFEHRPGEFVCVLAMSTEADEDSVFGLLDEIRQTVAKWLKLSITIGIGKSVPDLEQLPISYEMAAEAVGQKFLLGKNRIIMADNMRSDNEPSFRLRSGQIEALTSSLRAGNTEQTVKLLDKVISELTVAEKTNIRHFQYILLQLLLIGSGIAIEMNITIEEMDEAELWSRLLRLETAEETGLLLREYYIQVSNKIRIKRNDKSRSVIEEIKRIILECYSDPNLTIRQISDRIYLTSTYVSLIFKQETGKTVNEYLTEIRIEEAKRKLLETRCKLYDICSSVGYTDSSYFSKQFKKHTGLTPKEFREKPL